MYDADGHETFLKEPAAGLEMAVGDLDCPEGEGGYEIHVLFRGGRGLEDGAWWWWIAGNSAWAEESIIGSLCSSGCDSDIGVCVDRAHDGALLLPVFIVSVFWLDDAEDVDPKVRDTE